MEESSCLFICRPRSNSRRVEWGDFRESICFVTWWGILYSWDGCENCLLRMDCQTVW